MSLSFLRLSIVFTSLVTAYPAVNVVQRWSPSSGPESISPSKTPAIWSQTSLVFPPDLESLESLYSVPSYQTIPPATASSSYVAYATSTASIPIVPATDLHADADPSTAQRNISNAYQPNSSNFVTNPTYATFSNFDFQSIALAVHQEYIELDLFNYGLAHFSDADFDQAGINAENRELIRFMAQQEIGHAYVLSNMLGPAAPKMCSYRYPFHDVRSFIDFCQVLTRWGESGVYGFLQLLDNRAVAQILLQSITVEARQLYTFRQFEGLFPMPEWFETGLPQTWTWTLLHNWIVSCPPENQPLAWEIYPRLVVDNQPNAIIAGILAGGPAISHNVSAFSYPGRVTCFSWDPVGLIEGPYHQQTVTYTAGVPRFAAFVSQYNVTYSPLYDVDLERRTAKAKQPDGHVFGLGSDLLLNGTQFVVLTDTCTNYTPANLSLINTHIVAGPAIFQAG
ncbi:putative Rds1 protein [Violaceomyces palustris]|uniref:Rds1 protein n=1 Tax=Violaceomyces palustris TaxID=1673888 RepID=A0ACD0NVJ1_9BASI|nr:putative Rds1 protein [Violaceomyces palustris]